MTKQEIKAAVTATLQKVEPQYLHALIKRVSADFKRNCRYLN